MHVFNNLIMYKQDVTQNSEQSIVPDSCCSAPERLHSYVPRPAFVTGIRLRYSGARLTRWRAGHDTG